MRGHSSSHAFSAGKYQNVSTLGEEEEGFVRVRSGGEHRNGRRERSGRRCVQSGEEVITRGSGGEHRTGRE